MIENMMDFIKTYKWQCFAGGLVLLIGTGFLLLGQPAAPQDQTGLVEVTQSSSTEVSQSDDSPTMPKEASQVIMVDVKGAVKTPGLYELPAGARLHDAVRAAGGMLETADQKSVNLAQKLSDEAVVYVATKEEGISVLPSNNQTENSTTGAGNPADDKINLNTATESDLQTISGIGAKRAADIIAYRDSKGGFQSVDDLNDVPGIGDKTLENLRPYVTVD